MSVAEILAANIGLSICVTFDDGVSILCRVINVDDREHDDAFAELERVVDEPEKVPHVPGTLLRFFFSEIVRVEKDDQILFERKGI